MVYLKQVLGFVVFLSFTIVSYSQDNLNSEADSSATSVIATPLIQWNSISKDEQAEILSDLEYLAVDQLPSKTKVINYLDPSVSATSAKDLKVNNQSHKQYIKKIISVFESEVSREEIEQSEYTVFGESEISALYLLVDDSDKILGAYLSFYQDGRDQEGEDSDVNWQASVRFDANGEIFQNEDDQPYDELYFEWSGH